MSQKLLNIATEIESLTLLETSELVKLLEEKLGVSAAMPQMAMAAAPAEVAAVQEKTEFDVILKNAGANKINVIKEIRAITGLGLKEAKELSESIGKAIKSAVSKDEAQKIKAQLEAAGATIELV